MGRSWAPSDSCNGVLDVPVVATIGVSLTPDTRKKDKLAAPANAAYVSELAVEAASRGRGYGKLMLRAAEDMSMQVGARVSVFQRGTIGCTQKHVLCAYVSV